MNKTPIVLEGRVARSGPKGGPAQRVTEQWRNLVRLRLEDLTWTPADLAREVEKLLGEPMTRAGISHVLTKAKRSGLVGVIERAIGWKRDPIPREDAAKNAAELGITLAPDRLAWVQKMSDDIQRLAGSPEQRELDDIYDELDEPAQRELMLKARSLRQFQRKRRRQQNVEESDRRRREEIAGKVVAVQATAKQIDEQHRKTEELFEVAAVDTANRTERVLEAERDLSDLVRQEAALLTAIETTDRDAEVARKKQQIASTKVKRDSSRVALEAAQTERKRLQTELQMLDRVRAETYRTLEDLHLQHTEAVRIWSKHSMELEDLNKLKKKLGIVLDTP